MSSRTHGSATLSGLTTAIHPVCRRRWITRWTRASQPGSRSGIEIRPTAGRSCVPALDPSGPVSSSAIGWTCQPAAVTVDTSSPSLPRPSSRATLLDIVTSSPAPRLAAPSRDPADSPVTFIRSPASSWSSACCRRYHAARSAHLCIRCRARDRLCANRADDRSRRARAQRMLRCRAARAGVENFALLRRRTTVTARRRPAGAPPARRRRRRSATRSRTTARSAARSQPRAG